MRFLFILFLCIESFYSICNAQTPEDSVKAAINRFFAAMKNSDAKLLQTSFTDSAILQTIAVNDNVASVHSEPVHEFIDFIGGLPKDAADERIQFDIIKIDGPLAIAWTPYKFYFNGQFSHCGVNSFQLVRINGTWKIQYIIDTRRKQGCD